MKLNSTEEIIEDLKAGKMVVIMDDEDRENEGDLIMLAEAVKPADINFMAQYGRGLICLTLSQQRCQQLRLPLMVGNNNAQLSTNFTSNPSSVLDTRLKLTPLASSVIPMNLL